VFAVILFYLGFLSFSNIRVMGSFRTDESGKARALVVVVVVVVNIPVKVA